MNRFEDLFSSNAGKRMDIEKVIQRYRQVENIKKTWAHETKENMRKGGKGLTIDKHQTRNTRATAAVQQALLIDVNNTATAAWQAHGRRETRTLLYELGYEATNDLLDILHRPVYLAGYLNGYEKTVKYKSRLEAAEAAAEQGKESRKQLQELQKIDQEKTAELLEVKKLLQEEEANSIYWRKLYQQEAKENQHLRDINNELVQSLPDPEEMVKHTEQIEQQENQSVEERVMAALEAGMSYAEAGKLAGVSKSTAYRIKQQSEQNIKTEQISNIITIGKAVGESRERKGKI